LLRAATITVSSSTRASCFPVVASPDPRDPRAHPEAHPLCALPHLRARRTQAGRTILHGTDTLPDT
jgi:hypothetical protein